MKIFVIYPIIFFFLNTSPVLQIENDPDSTGLQSVFLIKQFWHTALVFSIDQIDTNILPEAKYFWDYNLIDFGWGDEEFYQYPGFDSGLAFSALFYPTRSTLRIEGLLYSKDDLVNYSEIVIKLFVDDEKLKAFNKFISKAITREAQGNSVILSSQAGGKIKFFRSPETYHLFRTCNTWVAEALHFAGFEIETDIILAEQLFNEAAKIGIVIKAPSDN